MGFPAAWAAVPTWGKITLIIVALSIGGYVVGELDNGMSATERGVAVFMACERAVKERLVAPATAQFEDVSVDQLERVAQNSYQLVSYVDAQNRMGAMLRMNFTCVVELHGDSAYRVSRLDLRRR